ncbi:MAG: phosphate ABC transporter substrate-binding protein PstS [Deltaproteobacteria bacterium]|nr:phosphate ABC transporter substrate-binding protein PstS [Deltaproteobacteria bacterium]
MKRLKVKFESRLLSLRAAAKVVLATGLALVAGTAFAGTPLSGAGSTFAYPFYTKWFYEYEKVTGVKINYQAIGSGGGIQQLFAGIVDFGASDKPLDKKTMQEHGVIQMPDAAGGIAIAYNIPGVGKGLKFTPELIADIYLGKITNWSDPTIKAVNPGVNLPALPIIVVHRSDGSGTTYIFTHYLAKISKEWATKVGADLSVNWPARSSIGAKGNPGVAGTIMKMQGTIGYVELAYVLQNAMTYGPVQNEAGVFVWPTIASARAAAATVKHVPPDFNVLFVDQPGRDSYPIAGFTYLIIYKKQLDSVKGKELLNFIKWAYTKGQPMLKELDYVPIPPSIIRQIDRQLKEVQIKP